MNAHSDLLLGRRLVLGVGGSIAAYKSLTLASRLTEAGAIVDVVLTRAAAELVRPLAFQALTHRSVTVNLFAPGSAMAMDHVALARSAEMLVVAPASADLLARLALGLADDALTTTALATRAPLLVAPAMEPHMWTHPATAGHVATLAERGARFVGPDAGRMASGASGLGRMAEPKRIIEEIRLVLAAGGPLSGRRILVTAGPTREPLDPVRYLSNHSSGRMGYAIARAARDAGADVTLVTGPVALAPPVGVAVVPVETALQMADEVLGRILGHAPGRADSLPMHALIMTAAVADYRPAVYEPQKIKKTQDPTHLSLARNPDILVELDHRLKGVALPPLRIGFAAETEHLLANAAEKRIRKGLDLIVANPVPAAFGGDLASATLIDADGATDLGELTKEAVAGAVVARVVSLLAARSA